MIQLTMKPQYFFSFTLGLVVAIPWEYTTTAPVPTVSCIVSGVACPTGSTCTPTMTCGGLCFSTQPVPPEIPCTVGATTGCPTGSTCTPTMTCPQTGSCGGACIATPTSAPSLTPCIVGANTGCPTGATCTPLSICPTSGACTGACITTTPAPSFTIPCVVSGADVCPTSYFCLQTETCRGVCIATPTPTPSKVLCVLERGEKHQCPAGSICTPTTTCLKHSRCGGVCIAKPTHTHHSTPKHPWDGESW